jgi:hypothetical protein
MKKFTFGHLALASIVGLGIGVGITIFFYSVFSVIPPGKQSKIMTLSEAKTSVQNGLNSKTALYCDTLRAWTISREQYDAMILINNNASPISMPSNGFRIYPGVDVSLGQIGIVVGVDVSGKDAVSGTIVSTAWANSGPCPTQCDATSPIMNR